MADAAPPRPPRKKVYPYPFGEPVPIDNSGEVTQAEIENVLQHHGREVTLLIRETEDAANRGGYLFNVRLAETGEIHLFTYTGREAYTFPNLENLVRFINHASGRRYDHEMWEISQEINLRVLSQAPEEAEEE